MACWTTEQIWARNIKVKSVPAVSLAGSREWRSPANSGWTVKQEFRRGMDPETVLKERVVYLRIVELLRIELEKTVT